MKNNLYLISILGIRSESASNRKRKGNEKIDFCDFKTESTQMVFSKVSYGMLCNYAASFGNRWCLSPAKFISFVATHTGCSVAAIDWTINHYLGLRGLLNCRVHGCVRNRMLVSITGGGLGGGGELGNLKP
jgi:hypothetical protein